MSRPVDWMETAACQGKAPYRTWALADRSIHGKHFKPTNGKHGKIRIYRCRYCAHWHIGASSF